ncbi:MAG: helicase-related protein, partial [Myxococcota bacterium]
NSSQTPAAGSPEQEAARAELRLLRSFVDRAERIASNSKGEALLVALKSALDKAEGLGARRKAVVFTESRKTQAWLRRMLEAEGYAGQIVLINGTNSDAESKATYREWLARHRDDGQVSGVRSADTRAALVEKFRDDATVLLATEAAAEGVNLQFCSLVVNYDLPWNPQRVEQRIGRCHRYGQKHDVVVVNFLNQKNAADQRVLQLLTDKFLLFEGVFGASDEVLGALGSGVDLEKRIAEIYQSCRTAEEIHAEFDDLQDLLRPLIEHRLAETREQILSHFDADVQERLRVHRDRAKATLDARQRWLLDLLRAELDHEATFAAEDAAFDYRGTLAASGLYHLHWQAAEASGASFLSQDHPLARTLIDRALGRELPPARLVLHLPDRGRVSRIEPYAGRSGWLAVERLTVRGAATDEFLMTAAVTDDGELLDPEVAARLWDLDGIVEGIESPDHDRTDLDAALDQLAVTQQAAVRERQAKLVDEEADKLSRWAEDEKLGLRLEIERFDQTIKDLQREVRQVKTLEEKLALRKRERDVDRQRTEKRRALFEAQDRVDAERDGLIGKLEAALAGKATRTAVLTVRWRIPARA